jgi:hypothetical protein
MEAPGRWASSDDPVFRTPYSSHLGDGKIRACPRNAADRVSVPHFCQGASNPHTKQCGTQKGSRPVPALLPLARRPLFCFMLSRQLHDIYRHVFAAQGFRRDHSAPSVA